MLVRRVLVDDAESVAALLGELGYPTEPEQMARRIARHASSADDPAWVGVERTDPSRVVGFVAGHCFRPYELERPVAELTALVVTESGRGGGVGRLLTQTVEEWAIARGCHRLTVASSMHRHDAHLFYERCGFGERSRRFEKEL